MTTTTSFRQHAPWLIAVGLSLVLALAITEGTRLVLEHDYRDTLATQAKQRAIDLTAQTMNGKVMGAVATLGLVSRQVKADANRESSAPGDAVTEILRAVGEANQANGVFVVGANGIIRSSWAATGKENSGLDIRFRSYFQIAMEGKPNVYAAIGTSRGMRSLYFSAPLYGEVSASSHVIGATVARLDIDQVNAVLNSWQGPAVLLSPQQISFASNRDGWVDSIAGEISPGKLTEIRELKQFGNAFESGSPKTLPFAVEEDTVSFDKHRYAVAREAIQWNDRQGDWTLVLLADLDSAMPLPQRLLIGILCGTLLLAASIFWLVWRRRLAHADAQRLRDEVALRAHADRLESESATKTYLAQLSAGLHRALSLSEFADKFMRHVAPRVNADDGAFFMVDDESERLKPVGGYGALRSELETMAVGQGLVDQCAKSMSPVELSGALSPKPADGAEKTVLLLPLVAQHGRLLGITALAFQSAITREKRALLETTLPMAAMNLEILERNLGTQRQAIALQRQQANLKETKAWFRRIIEAAPDGMLVTDESGTIILANPTLETMFGYGAGQLIGKSIEALVPSQGNEGLLRNALAAQSASTESHEQCGVRADGLPFPIEIGISSLPALSGHELCFCASVRDITERKQAAKTLDQRMEELERFNRLTVGREEKMIELKDQINALLEQIGQPKQYKIVE